MQLLKNNDSVFVALKPCEEFLHEFFITANFTTLQADSAKVFMDEKDSELEFEDNVKEDNSWIERIKVIVT